MSSLPHDLMDEAREQERELENINDDSDKKSIGKLFLVIVMVLTIIIACVLSALVSWLVVDIKSARQSPIDVRLSALEAGLAVNGGAIEGQAGVVAELSEKINSLDSSIAYFRNTFSATKLDELTRETKALRLKIDAIKLKLEVIKKSPVPKVINNNAANAPVTRVISNTSARVYSIRTQGEKQWVTLIDGGRISRSLSIGDVWNNVKIKQIEDSKVVVEINRKDVALTI